jgi:1-deoxy-D-xylulose-5-phosphate reductoisomerase
VTPLDLARIGTLAFEHPDLERFPALRLGYAALESGGCAPAMLNAANEVTVAAFLDRRLSFLDMTAVIDQTLQELPMRPLRDLADVLEADRLAREKATALVRRAAAALA